MGTNELDIEATIEALRTFAAFAGVETSVEELGQELEYHHERLGKTAEREEKNI